MHRQTRQINIDLVGPKALVTLTKPHTEHCVRSFFTRFAISSNRTIF